MRKEDAPAAEKEATEGSSSAAKETEATKPVGSYFVTLYNKLEITWRAPTVQRAP